MGGPLCPSSTLGLFSLVPGLRQFPVSSSTESPMSPLGSGREVWVLTQDRQGDSNSQGGMGIVGLGQENLWQPSA